MVNGYVLVRDNENAERQTAGGLILPPERYQRFCTIVAVPDSEENFKVGDVVLKPIGRGTPVTIDGVEYECIKATNIFGKASKEELQQFGYA